MYVFGAITFLIAVFLMTQLGQLGGLGGFIGVLYFLGAIVASAIWVWMGALLGRLNNVFSSLNDTNYTLDSINYSLQHITDVLKKLKTDEPKD